MTTAALPVPASRTDYWLPRIITWLAPLAGLVLVFVFFATMTWLFTDSPTFATGRNAVTIFRQTAIVGTAALGMTMIIVSGGIDLSVGSSIALTTVVIARLLVAGCPPWLAALGGIAVATALGLFNGSLIALLRVGPFIVTLGTMLVLRGSAKGLAHEQKIDAPLTWITDLLAPITHKTFASALPGQIGGLVDLVVNALLAVPIGVWALLAMAILVAAGLRYLRFGRHVFAIGSNELTARLCGVHVPRVKIAVYALGGLFAGIAGLMQFARLTVGDPTVAVGLELNVIAAVVIGGGSLAGGEGTIFGTIVGALIMTTIASGCTQMGWPNWVQEIVTGTIIVIAVALDRLRHSRAA